MLAGLGSAQHKWYFDASQTHSGVHEDLAAPYQWSSEVFVEEIQIYDEEDRVKTLHPVFALPENVPERTRAYFIAKGGF